MDSPGTTVTTQQSLNAEQLTAIQNLQQATSGTGNQQVQQLQLVQGQGQVCGVLNLWEGISVLCKEAGGITRCNQ